METNNTAKDPELWELAKKRAGFRYHLITYIIMNSFFWIIWLVTGQRSPDNFQSGMYLPWPIWPMFGWGIGLLFHYIGAYVYTKETLTEREYQKLKNKQL